jgi:hypothetical protein
MNLLTYLWSCIEAIGFSYQIKGASLDFLIDTTKILANNAQCQ